MEKAKRFFLLWALSGIPACAQFTYPGCANVVQSDFQTVTLVANRLDPTVREPMKMALATNAQGNVDVYFVQRYGMVRKYDGTSKATSTLANFNFPTDSVSDGFSEGVLGIALDPGFKTNNWIYLYIAIKNNWRITRYTLKGVSLDLATAVPILRFSSASFSQHMGSALRFDDAGNLWITVADNGGGTNPASATNTNLYQAANTNSYFGKILRIKPRAIPDNQTAPAPGLGSTYDVPTGNLFPQGTAKTLPEIYVMGTRNPYTIDFDRGRGAMTWGDVGPDNYPGSTDTNQWTEEHNFTTRPGFFGWPYWAGNQGTMPTQALPPGSTPASPINNRADNSGLTNLPPAIAPMEHYVKNCALTGPVYYYDGTLNSTIKFPPHFNGAWLIGDFNGSWIDAAGFNASATAIAKRQRLVTAASSANTLNAPLEMQMGPDGALYVMNYSGYRSFDGRSGILRIEYKGTCLPSTPALNFRRPGPALEFDGAFVHVNLSGPHSVEVWDVAGRLEMRLRGASPARYDLREIKAPGIHLLVAQTPEGMSRRTFIR